MKLILVFILTMLLLSTCDGMGNKNQGHGNGQGNNKHNGKKVAFYPCGSSVLKEERIIGGNLNKQRVWNGFLDISAVTHSEKVIVTMVFNYPLHFELVSQFKIVWK